MYLLSHGSFTLSHLFPEASILKETFLYLTFGVHLLAVSVQLIWVEEANVVSTVITSYVSSKSMKTSILKLTFFDERLWCFKTCDIVLSDVSSFLVISFQTDGSS